MSIASIIVRGYGAFGTVNFLPTLGYSSGEAVPTDQPSGGWPIDGSEYARRAPRVRTPEEIREDRVKFGVLPARIIEDVAARQAADYRLDDEQRAQELRAEMKLQGLEMRAAHLEALNAHREALIRTEVAMRLRQRMDEQDLMFLTILAANV